MIAPCGVDLVRAPVPGPKRMAMFMNWAGLCIRTKYGRTIYQLHLCCHNTGTSRCAMQQ